VCEVVCEACGELFEHFCVVALLECDADNGWEAGTTRRFWCGYLDEEEGSFLPDALMCWPHMYRAFIKAGAAPAKLAQLSFNCSC
jgi:hypothetical protein